MEGLTYVKMKGVRRTKKVREWEKYVSEMLNKKLEEQDAVRKFSKAIILGLPIYIDKEGNITVVDRDKFYKK